MNRLNTLSSWIVIILIALPTSLAYATNRLATSMGQHSLPLFNIADALTEIAHAAPDIDVKALRAGLRAYAHLIKLKPDIKPLLTIVDFSLPSNQRRLWLVDMLTKQVLLNTYVAHGKNSGGLYAKRFSDKINSYQSSLGVYLTGKSYRGIDGYSMRLHGLERGFNDQAYARHIVMHPARYVTQAFLKAHGYLGHTLGCFGLAKTISHQLIDAIKEGSTLVAYYPEHAWLSNSTFEAPLT